MTAPERLVTRLSRWSRRREWFDSKVAWLGTACYYLALVNGWPPVKAAVVALQVVPFTIALAAFGYALNDYSDREVDLTAGKRTADSAPPAAMHFRLVGVLLVVTLLALAPMAFQGISLLAGLTLTVLAVAYSMPPVRLKTRGIWGVLAAALAQWGTPILPLLSSGAAVTAGGAILLTLGVSAGLRWMLIHQIQDAPADARTGVRTFTVAHGVDRASTVARVLVSVEAVLLLVWMGIDSGRMPVLGVLSGVYIAAFALIWFQLARVGLAGTSGGAYERAPLRGLYLAWLPLGFLAALTWTRPAYGWLIPIELWFRRYQIAGDVRMACHAAGIPPPWSRR
ncbi:MAG: UbiA family prenyltransferase [Vicinamibacterales bacterium]